MSTLEKEIEVLQAQITELAEAFVVLWVSADHSEWDATAVTHFDVLLERYKGELHAWIEDAER